MKYIHLYKKRYIFSIILFLIVLFRINSFAFPNTPDPTFLKNSISLSNNPSWYTVLGGQAITQPVKTSYGFAVVSDGRLLTACNNNGEILWQKGLTEKTSPYFISGFSDTLYLVSQTGKLSMYNPSGMILWEHQLEEYPTENLFLGDDGRLFVKGLNTITCFSMTGKIKWKLNIGQTLPINTTRFADGSLLVVLKKEVNGCSTALRISPYGKILEEIIFTGIVTSCSSSNNGILVGFTNGEVGYINIVENKSKTIWSVLPSVLENSVEVYPVNIYSEKNIFYVCFSNQKIISIQSGKILWSLQTNVNLNMIHDFYSDGQNIYIITGTNTICINKKGNLQKNYTYSYGSSTFPFYLEPGFLVFSTPDWCINAFRIVQTVGKYKSKILLPKAYDDKNYKIQNNYSLIDSINLLQSDNTSECERDILKQLSFEIQDIYSYYFVTKEQQHRLRGVNGVLRTAETLEACGYTGLGCYTSLLSLIIENETDISIVTAAIKAAGKLCYDDGKIIDSMEVLSRKSYFKNNVVLQKEFCICLYEICRFMGKPIVLNKGKDILVYLLTSISSDEIMKFARETMEKIIALQM